MKLRKLALSTALLAISGIASGQTPSQTPDSYVGAAKVAAGTDWAGTFLRLCIPPPARGAAAPAGNRTTPARAGSASPNR